MSVRAWLSAGMVILVAPLGLRAQVDQGAWTVDLTPGAQIFPEASALKTGASVAIETAYQITDRLALGPTMQYVRTHTDETFFVAVLDFGAANSKVYQVGQRINTLTYGAMARFDLMPESKFDPYVVGGGGFYTIYLEPQSYRKTERLTDAMFQVGGGLHYAVTETTGVRLDVRDMVYTNFDRDNLNPVRADQRNCAPGAEWPGGCHFPEAERSSLPANKATIHNLRFSIGLSYVPGGN